MKTEIKVFANKEPKGASLGYGSITFEDTVIIQFSILSGKTGPFVSWPSFKKGDGTYTAQVMISKDNNYEIVNEIIAEFNKVFAISSSGEPKEPVKSTKTVIPKVDW